MKIYIAATRQNDGKTTTVLGLLNAIKDIYPNTGYIKPIGQQTKVVNKLHIDKDAHLIDKIFKIDKPLYDMSPITVPRGFTEDYILHGSKEKLDEKIVKAYANVSKDMDFMVIEGTGHAGVGSIFDLSNAAVAKLLNAPVLLVSCGGLGRPIDEIALNKALFDRHGVELLGVVINKVLPGKIKKINKLIRLGLKKQNIDVLGVVPYDPVLANPTIQQLSEDIHGEVISGEENLNQSINNIIVGAMPVHDIINYLKGEVLLITPGNRADLIFAAITCQAYGIGNDFNIRGILLTCGIKPHKSVIKIIRETKIPVILTRYDTYNSAEKVTKLIIKIKPGDKEKISTVKQVIKKYVDVDLLIEKVRKYEEKQKK